MIIVKPDRIPDFSCTDPECLGEYWSFYVEERVQYNHNINKCFEMKIDNNILSWRWSEKTNEWSEYEEKIQETYENYLIERILLN